MSFDYFKYFSSTMAIIKCNDHLQQHAIVELGNDDVLEVTLSENRTTGYRWQLLSHDGFNAEETTGHKTQLPGAGGKAVFTITPWKPVSAGLLKFEYRRPWEKDVEPEKIFTVEVQPASNNPAMDTGHFI